MGAEPKISIQVNGQDQCLPEKQTLGQLVAGIHTGPGIVVAEINGVIQAREAWNTTFLKAGDRVELVHFVGGG